MNQEYFFITSFQGYFTFDYNFDFFNYAGIHRPVVLYTTPKKLYVKVKFKKKDEIEHVLDAILFCRTFK